MSILPQSNKNRADRYYFRSIILFIIILLVIPTLSVLSISNSQNTQNICLTKVSNPKPIADIEFFFDFGEAASPLKTGYTKITPTSKYNASTGYGLLSNTSSYYVKARNLPEYSASVLQRAWVYNEYGDTLTKDGLRSENVTFRVDLPNGTYLVRTWLGDLEKGVYSMNISYNDDWQVEGAAAFHIVYRGMYFKMSNYGYAVPYTRKISVTNKTMVINVTGNDTKYYQDLQAELAKSPAHSYPHWMSTGGYKYSQGTGPWRYINGPFTNASVLGLEIYPPPELPVSGDVGTITLDVNVTNNDLKNTATSINNGQWNSAFSSWEDAAGSTLTGANLIARAQLGEYLAGSLKLDNELTILPQVELDLTTANNTDPFDRGVTDLLKQVKLIRKALHYYTNRTGFDEEGRNHFIESDKAIMLLWTIEQDSPLYPKMMLWCARALYSLDPHRWTSASGTAKDIMGSIRYLDPDNKYISFYQDTTRDLLRTWVNGTEVLSTTGEKDAWFLKNYTHGFENAPQWARIVHEELCWLYDFTDWWIDHRMSENGYLGGGWSDDVEFIGLFGFDALISEGANDKSLEGGRRFVEGMLASGDVDMDLGFSSAFADAEHTAELTGDSLPMMIAVDFGNPRWLEFSMKTAVLMRDLWMGENNDGNLQFKSNFLSATKIGTGGQAEDSWINYRAALPARWVWWYSGDPEIEDLFLGWADSWVDAALSTEKSKPKGVIPSGIGWPDGEIGGHNAPSWYQAAHPAGSVNYDWDRQQYKSYITDLLVGAFEATGNKTYLEPLRLEAEIAQDYINDPDPRPDAGTAKWAGQILGQNAIDRYQTILDTYGLPGANPAATLWTRDDVVSSCINGYNYIKKCYPLMTTEASATDRVAFVGVVNPFSIYTGGGAGGALLAPAYTYTGLGRDFAAMVQYTNRSSGSILLYGFFNGLRQCGLVPWTLEPGATYTLKGGPDANGDSIRDSTEQEHTFVFKSRGMEVPFNLTGRTEYILDIEKIVDGTGKTLLPDPAWGEEETAIDKKNGTVNITIHNLGAANATDLEIIIIESNQSKTQSENQTIVAWGIIDDLPPPSNILPSIMNFDLQVVANGEKEQIYQMIIDPQEKMDQITTRNDIKEVILNLSGIHVDQPPSLTPNPFNPFIIMNENQTKNFSVSIIDEDIINITYLWRLDGVMVEDNKSYFQFSTNFSSAGQHILNITIMDSSLLKQSASFEWNITVMNINRLPVIMNLTPGKIISINEIENGTIIFSINATDPDNDMLSYSWFVNSISKPNENKINSTYSFNFNFTSAGEYKIKVVINDTLDNISMEWQLTINNTNRPPSIMSYFPTGNSTINDTTSITFNITGHDPDVDDILGFKWYKNNSLIAEEKNSSYKYIPIQGENNSLIIKVKLYDDKDGNTTHTWFLTVVPSIIEVKEPDKNESKNQTDEDKIDDDKKPGDINKTDDGNDKDEKDKEKDKKEQDESGQMSGILLALGIIVIISLIFTIILLFIVLRIRSKEKGGDDYSNYGKNHSDRYFNDVDEEYIYEENEFDDYEE